MAFDILQVLQTRQIVKLKLTDDKTHLEVEDNRHLEVNKPYLSKKDVAELIERLQQLHDQMEINHVRST